MSTTSQKRDRNHKRIRTQVSGTALRPRLCVFKSNISLYAQLIDDENGVTLTQASSRDIKSGTKSEAAKEIGSLIAKRAAEKNIKAVVFDRGGYLYRGKVQALAEGAREGGLTF